MPPIPVPPTPLDPALSPTATPGTGTPIQGGPSTSLKGWNDLAYAVASDVPTAHKRAAMLRATAARTLARVGTRR